MEPALHKDEPMVAHPSPRIGVVIPSFRVQRHILDVIAAIGPEVTRVYVVDDCCPDGSGDFVQAHCRDPRVLVLRNAVNLGVGGAVIAGYKQAIAEKLDVVVKIDGDGQMDPALLMRFVQPILRGQADYTKGNRFFELGEIHRMPPMRIFGNAVLSFMTKLSSGYWDIFDPTNGYTAAQVGVLSHLPLHKISERYFFESDMLFRLNTLRAVVQDIPMDAHYGDEKSHLKVSRVIPEFLFKHTRNFLKRIFYNYYLRGMSIASLELPIGLLLFVFGGLFGSFKWWHSAQLGQSTPVGTIMIAVVALLAGLQFILAFLNFDVQQTPTIAGRWVRRS